MNWKNILTKGLPVLGVIVALAIGFTVASRPKPVPKVSNPNDLVVEFQGLKIKKNELYELMKASYGKASMLKHVDSIVLASYFDKVDETTLNTEINKLKGKEGDAEALQAYYDQLTYSGIYREANESEEAFEARVKEYQKYNLNLVQKVAARDRAEKSTTEEDINTAKSNYKVDLCIIPLKFETQSAYETAKTTLTALSGEALKTKVDEYYTTQKEAEETEDEEDTDVEETAEEKFFSKQINCETTNSERVKYNDLSAAYRDFIYGTASKSGIAKGTIGYQSIGNVYHIVYKADEAKNPTDYTPEDKVEFTSIIKNQLIDAKVTTAYINETVVKLRNDAGFKIYDPVLAEGYKADDKSFELTKSKDKKAVYEINGAVTTTDDLFNILKTTNAISFIMNKVNYAALTQVAEIQLTKTEKENIKKQIAQIKADFLAQGYSQMITWADYMKFYGANSEAELGNLLALDTLTQRYILGYKVDDAVKFAGVYPVAHEEIKEQYTKWFEITASHILFKIDSESKTLEADTKRAELLAKQLIEGYEAIKVEAVGYLAPEDFLTYDHDGNGKLYFDTNENGKMDETETREYFKGLKNVKGTEYNAVFSDLARRYSDDKGSGASGGSLGAFGPGKMVKPFEEATLEVARTKEVSGPFSGAVKSEFGIHVIYVTGETKKPAAPAGYEDKTIDQIRAVLATETNTDLKTYFDFIAKFETTLQQEHMSEANLNKFMAKVRSDYGFKFLDQDIQNYYDKIVAIQTRVKSETEAE